MDSQQFVPVSGERISERLQPIFECYMFLMEQAILGNWWTNLTVNDVKVRDADSDGFEVIFNVNNSGYVDVVNGTADLQIGSRNYVTNFSVGQFNETNLSINVTGDWEGKQDIMLTLHYTRLTLNTSQPQEFVYTGTIKVEWDEGFLPAPGVITTLGAVLVVLLVSLLKRKRSGS